MRDGYWLGLPVHAGMLISRDPDLMRQSDIPTESLDVACYMIPERSVCTVILSLLGICLYPMICASYSFNCRRLKLILCMNFEIVSENRPSVHCTFCSRSDSSLRVHCTVGKRVRASSHLRLQAATSVLNSRRLLKLHKFLDNLFLIS